MSQPDAKECSSLPERAALNHALCAAHAEGDLVKLVALYRTAGEFSEDAGDIDAACFYLTHALVYALEIGAPDAMALEDRLRLHGRI